MNIAGRAREQLQATSESAGGPEEKQFDDLSPDINGIITSLQFQDITRQQIEKVIGRIDRFQQELSDMKRDLESGKAPARGPESPDAGGEKSTRREHA